MKRTVQTGRGKFLVDEEGSGDPVVFIHGGLTESGIWEDQIAFFAGNFRAMAYDRRGYGESDLPTAPFRHCDDLACVLDALRLDKAVIVGCSAGGGVAIDFALEYPQRVEKLILITPSIGGLSYPLGLTLRTIRHAINYGRFGLEKAAELFINDPFWAYFVPGEKGARDKFTASFLANARFYSGKQTMERPLKPGAIKRLGEIARPTLLIGTDRDAEFNKRACRMLERGISGIESREISQSGHLPNLEAPGETNRIIEEFLKR
jgi:pimeloyl-ACP methyl ester carboxylesterase